MSSTGRSEISTENWETPRWAVRRLLEEVYIPPGIWVEAGAGNGRIIQAVEEDRPGQIIWHAVEQRPECIANLERIGLHTAGLTVHQDDFLTWDARTVAKSEGRQIYARPQPEAYFDVAIMNPPFSKATEFLSKCLAIANHVFMLQRRNWVGSGSNNGKNDLLRGCMPDEFNVPDRIKFMKNGVFPNYPDDYKKVKLRGKPMPGDSIEYTWYYWPPSPERFRFKGSTCNLMSTSKEERIALELIGP